METLFNILVIAFVALIAYWWSNQGLFGSILHFLCVLCAGVLAFATWEPISRLLLGSLPGLAPYAWGIGLLLPFGFYLFLLRLGADKLAPDNLNFPHLINLLGGGAVGVLSGLLTVGITLIGVGHIHSTARLMDFAGVVRTQAAGIANGQPAAESGLWVPAHRIAAATFGGLSLGSMSPTLTTPTLAAYHPRLGDDALGLFRDGFIRNGRLAKVAALPGSVTLESFIFVNDPAFKVGMVTGPAYVAEVKLTRGASTEGQMIVVSASQVRLVGKDATTTTGVAYPVIWGQRNANGGRVVCAFDDRTAFAASAAGEEELVASFVFPASNTFAAGQPIFLEVMGQRMDVSQFAQQPPANAAAGKVLVFTGSSAGASTLAIDTSAPKLKPSDLTMNRKVDPAGIDLNSLNGMETDPDAKQYISSGHADYERGGFKGSKGLTVKGIACPVGSSILRLDISRGRSSVDVWGAKRTTAGESAALQLLDEQGQSYTAIGFIHISETGDKLVTIDLRPEEGMQTISMYPQLSQAGGDKLYAIYRLPSGKVIKAVMLGSETIGTCDYTVPTQFE